jgi:hypothetical protein
VAVYATEIDELGTLSPPARGGVTVKVFISWSGEPSRTIARALSGWLESVIHHVDTWMSDEEIGSGQRWNDAIAKSLDETNFGIVCVTRDNQHAPWLIFEAGALAKSVKVARVVPLYVDLVSSDVTGPLAGFQGRSLDEAGMRRLVHDLSGASEKPMSRERLDEIFDAMWPILEVAVARASEHAPTNQAPRRSSEDMLAEVVQRLRRVERTLSAGVPSDLEAFRNWLVAHTPPGSEIMNSAFTATLNALADEELGLLTDEYLTKTAARRAAIERRVKRATIETPSEVVEQGSQQEDVVP